VTEAVAESAVGKLAELSADLLSAALVAADGTVLASTDEAPWSERTAQLWEAADSTSASTGSGSVNQLHIAADAAEVFAVREEGVTAIAVTDRFALESLMFCDLRAALRELSAGAS